MNSAAVDKWLKDNGHSREWLAASIGRSLSTVMRILGSKKPPKTHLLAISHVTGIPVEELSKASPAKRHKEPALAG
jgi:hypothetical protein